MNCDTHSHNTGWNQPCVKNLKFQVITKFGDPLDLEFVGQITLRNLEKLREF
jgi:hypothetical protein